MNIKPLYRSDSEILVGLEDDFREVCVLDGLVIIIDLKNRKIKQPPWSGQKILQNGKYRPILKHQKEEYRQKIKRALRKRKISDLESKLRNPSEEAINSLLWIPHRLNPDK